MGGLLRERLNPFSFIDAQAVVEPAQEALVFRPKELLNMKVLRGLAVALTLAAAAWRPQSERLGAATSDQDAPAVRQQQSGADDAILAFVGARIIDGSGAPPLEDGVLVVQKGRIVAVGTADATKIPPGAARIGVRGKTIVPGF